MKKLDTMRFIVGRFTSFSTEIELLPKIFLYSMKIKVQTRKLAAGCSKHCFEVVDRTDEVSSKHGFEVADRTDGVSSKHGFEVVDETDGVSNHTYGKATLTWFEEIFEEY
ncbi:N-ethylammeline chlorohydrolase [Streptococcus pneumoniae]|nr:N-ethylammeline chlorohydrolase [Streptococcus pneumoniae]